MQTSPNITNWGAHLADRLPIENGALPEARPSMSSQDPAAALPSTGSETLETESIVQKRRHMDTLLKDLSRNMNTCGQKVENSQKEH